MMDEAGVDPAGVLLHEEVPMLKTAMAVLVLYLTTAAIAAANPIAADIYIDFDPPNEVFFVYPTQYVAFDA